MPKYKVGDRIRTTSGRTFTITALNGRPVKCYNITGAQGGRYICGDDEIAGLASEVTKADAKQQGFEGRFDHAEGVRFCKGQVQVDSANNERWEKVASLKPGDPVTLYGKPYFFVGVKTRAHKTPIIASTTNGAAYRFPIGAVRLDGNLPSPGLALTAVPNDALFAEASRIVNDLNEAREKWESGQIPNYDILSSFENEKMHRLHEIDDELRPQGVVPGRLVGWSEADGKDLYLLTGIGSLTCDLKHIEALDGYRSPAVSSSGKALREVVEETLHFEDEAKRIFDEAKRNSDA